MSCIVCKFKNWLYDKLFHYSYCVKCDTVSPPTFSRKLQASKYGGGMKWFGFCSKCVDDKYYHRENSIWRITKDRIDQLRKQKINTERHVKEQEEFRRLKSERKKNNEEMS